MDTIDDIINGCKKGRRDCQEKLYTLFSAKMFGVCLRYANNRSDAEDVLQEGFIKIFSKIEQYEFKGSFEGWMRRIMVTTALMRYRTQSHQATIPVDEFYDATGPVDAGTNTMESQDLLNLIGQLPPRYKMVFNLFAIEGYSHQEIAKMLEISEGTSKSNLARARAILQEKVQKIYHIQDKVKTFTK
ncbi:MAG TPA: RNA polymerase sigma factor [Bacteroidales bacterium]|nr:RNA polymerase sigma factor [Bacteroidales bacterium]